MPDLRNIIHQIIPALVSFAFLAAGLSKLAGADMMIQVFDTLGVGQWFRYLTGLIEISAVILLWLPGKRAFGAALLVVTMVGAVASHFLILGPSAMPAAVLGLLSALILFQNRAQLKSQPVR
jgi:putative oxidoreductase